MQQRELSASFAHKEAAAVDFLFSFINNSLLFHPESQVRLGHTIFFLCMCVTLTDTATF